MGKLGKKARKFAKKNLQSVYKRNRKINSMINSKKKISKDKLEKSGKRTEVAKDTPDVRNPEEVGDACIDTIFGEEGISVVEDDSDSDGYLSEDSGFSNIIQSEDENYGEETNDSALFSQNKEIDLELAKQKKKLFKLKKKDPGYSIILESYNKSIEAMGDVEDFSDEETSNYAIESVNEDSIKLNKGKILTVSVICSWSHLVKEQNSLPAFTCLINGFRAACHYGTESAFEEDISHPRIQNNQTYCNILTFMLGEADSLFRKFLGVSCSTCKKDTILDLKNTSKWKVLKPLIKSYLRSTLFLLNQVSIADILTLSLTRLGASLIFFAAFPSLLRRLIKVAVNFWATGGQALSSCSFNIMRDVANAFSADLFDTCLIKCYKAFIASCKFVEPVILKKIEFMKNSIVELCSLDVQRMYNKALLSVQQLAKILQYGLQSRKKEAIEKISSWQYICCIDLWVSFISANMADNDLQSLLFMIIQVVNGIANLFPGPRYLPLRVRCIQWLNRLSSSSGVFIPVASFVLDIMDYNSGKDGGKTVNAINLAAVTTACGNDTKDYLVIQLGFLDLTCRFHQSVLDKIAAIYGLLPPSLLQLQVPKDWLKARNLQEECVISAIELLSEHYAYWSYHISFPELATIPIIRLRKFCEVTSNESSRRLVKHLIDQVEQNIKFVQKKRDEVSFSPQDQQQVESFLQLEKPRSKASFVQYYESIIEKAASRKLAMNEKICLLEQKRSRKRKKQLPTLTDVNANDRQINLEKAKINSSVTKGTDENKKQRT